jgi:hydrogenase nickel incorporation protein HypA/HybF
MHEVALAMALTELAVAQARKADAARVTRLVVELGAFSHVDPLALRTAYEVAVRDTICEGAILELLEREAFAYCLACESRITVRKWDDPCPRCGGHPLPAKGDDEMRLKEIEVV